MEDRAPPTVRRLRGPQIKLDLQLPFQLLKLINPFILKSFQFLVVVLFVTVGAITDKHTCT